MFLAPRRDKVIQMPDGSKAMPRLDDRGWKLIAVRSDGTLSETIWSGKTDQEAIALLQGSIVTRDQIAGVNCNAEVEKFTPPNDVPDPEPARREPAEHILQFFEYSHLPEKLQFVSSPFGRLAHVIVENIPRNPERTVALRKLLEAKDAAVRAYIAK